MKVSATYNGPDSFFKLHACNLNEIRSFIWRKVWQFGSANALETLLSSVIATLLLTTASHRDFAGAQYSANAV